MDLWIDLIKSFVIGGLICVIGQLLFDIFKLTPAHTMCVLVTSGSILGAFGLYQKLVDYAGFGASLPIVNFGNVLVKGTLDGVTANGFLGVFQGLWGGVSTGVTAAIAFAFIVALLFRSQA